MAQRALPEWQKDYLGRMWLKYEQVLYNEKLPTSQDFGFIGLGVFLEIKGGTKTDQRNQITRNMRIFLCTKLCHRRRPDIKEVFLYFVVLFLWLIQS